LLWGRRWRIIKHPHAYPNSAGRIVKVCGWRRREARMSRNAVVLVFSSCQRPCLRWRHCILIVTSSSTASPNPLPPARPPDLPILPQTFHSHHPSSLVLVAADQEARRVKIGIKQPRSIEFHPRFLGHAFERYDGPVYGYT